MVHWAEWLRGDLLSADAIEMLKALPAQQEVGIDVLRAVFAVDAIAGLLASVERGPGAMLAWWRNHLAVKVRKRVQSPAQVAERRGARTLQETPQVTVGTIHSVKGGQADVVYLSPDLSRAGDAQYRRGGTSRDAVLRTVYVGATRARETLYICQRTSAMAVSI
jgi:UvrD-like helicase C-terminal domain